MLSDFELDAQVPDSIHPYALTGTLLFTGGVQLKVRVGLRCLVEDLAPVIVPTSVSPKNAQGAIESAHRYVMQTRLKIAGAWWKVENLKKMARTGASESGTLAASTKGWRLPTTSGQRFSFSPSCFSFLQASLFLPATTSAAAAR